MRGIVPALVQQRVKLLWIRPQSLSAAVYIICIRCLWYKQHLDTPWKLMCALFILIEYCHGVFSATMTTEWDTTEDGTANEGREQRMQRLTSSLQKAWGRRRVKTPAISLRKVMPTFSDLSHLFEAFTWFFHSTLFTKSTSTILRVLVQSTLF